MTSSTTHQAEPVSASEPPISDRLTEAVIQAEMLCSIEGEQSEVCELAQAYVEAVRSEATAEEDESKPSR